MKALYHKNFEDKNYFSLHWAITNNCNYKCDYCGVHKKEKYYDFHKIIEFINYIGSIKNVDTVLFGGEPLIHPNILQIVGELNTNIRICTNLDRNEDFLWELIKIRTDLKFITSYHYGKTNFKRFYEKVSFLLDYCELLKIKVMWDSRYKDEIQKDYPFFYILDEMNENVKTSLDMVYHPICEFSLEDIKYFDNNQRDKSFFIVEDEGSKAIKTSYNEIRRMFNGFPNFYEWECYCGKNGLFINSNGDVSYCQTKKNKGKVIFNVNKDNFMDFESILHHTIICDEDDFCTEVVIPRKKL